MKSYRTFRISGAGDRFLHPVGVDGCTDELNASNNPRMNDGGYVARMQLSSATSDEGLTIHAIYDGSWAFAVSPVEADANMPNWPIRREWRSPTSETIEIDVPHDTKFLLVDPLEQGPSSYAPIPDDQILVRPPPFLRSELYRFLIIALLFSLFMLPVATYVLFVENPFDKSVFAFYPLIALAAAWWLTAKRYPRIDYVKYVSRDMIPK